ncbi:MAG: HAD-IIA family hydrolase, partial [Chloroflexi bacterium]|nr:HAD-IIA family hydrolase [Chloroflexota bacterium]
DFLRARAIRFIIATNNSARPSSEIVGRLARFGITITENQVLTSAEAPALYLPRVIARGARVFLVGGEGIANELTRAGFQLVEENAEAVVVGLDTNLTYQKLKRAALEIRRGAKFVGTNADKTYPTEEGLVPGSGPIIAALETATDVAPIIIGKPERALFDIAIEKLAAPRECVAMLGDRLDTDIEGAQRAGLRSILVFTGVATRASLEHSDIQPDFIAENLDALREMWSR